MTQGYLGLVTINALDDTILSWQADTADCAQLVSSAWYHMKNFGTEAIQLCSPVEPETPQFSVVSDCNCFNSIGPGETTPCSLRVSFNSNLDGVFTDTMYIETDAQNSWGGYVRVPLYGVRMSTPRAPDVVLSIQGADAHLYWNRVTSSVGGCNLTVSGYNVYFSPTDAGPFLLLATTADTSFVHAGAVYAPGGLFYHVVAQAISTFDLLNPLQSNPSGAAGR